MRLTTGIMQALRLLFESRIRGQILSSEFILACSIFMFVLLSVLVMWSATTREMTRSEILYDMDNAATNAVEKLARTSGLPGDWASLPMDNVSSIGLSNESRRLDREKVKRFVYVMENAACVDPDDNPCISTTKYDCNRYLLGLGRYNFFFNMTYLNGSAVELDGDECVTGVAPAGDDYLLSKTRNALLGDDIMRINFIIWY